MGSLWGWRLGARLGGHLGAGERSRGKPGCCLWGCWKEGLWLGGSLGIARGALEGWEGFGGLLRGGCGGFQQTGWEFSGFPAGREPLEWFLRGQQWVLGNCGDESIGLLRIWELFEAAAVRFRRLGMNPAGCWEQVGLGDWE